MFCLEVEVRQKKNKKKVMKDLVQTVDSVTIYWSVPCWDVLRLNLCLDQ